MEVTTEQRLNPWITMWTRPRATVQQIVDTDAERLVLVLAAAAGFSEGLDRAAMGNMGDRFAWPVIVVIAAVAGPIFGVVSLYVGAVFFRWTGKWIGGKASTRNIRAAIAWSHVPLIWALILWIPYLLLFGQDSFTSNTETAAPNPLVDITLAALFVVEATVVVWTAIVFLKSLGQVQGFSAWKALGNTLLAFLAIVVLALALVLGTIFLGSQMA